MALTQWFPRVFDVLAHFDMGCVDVTTHEAFLLLLVAFDGARKSAFLVSVSSLLGLSLLCLMNEEIFPFCFVLFPTDHMLVFRQVVECEAVNQDAPDIFYMLHFFLT